jgi:hypothetical protein
MSNMLSCLTEHVGFSTKMSDKCRLSQANVGSGPVLTELGPVRPVTRCPVNVKRFQQDSRTQWCQFRSPIRDSSGEGVFADVPLQLTVLRETNGLRSVIYVRQLLTKLPRKPPL